jgi:hypothetical protein
LKREVTELSDRLKHRRDLIQAELHAMDACNSAHAALLNDGYPEVIAASLPDDLYTEMQGQLFDIEAGLGVFQKEASAMTIDLGKPVPKPAAPAG